MRPATDAARPEAIADDRATTRPEAAEAAMREGLRRLAHERPAEAILAFETATALVPDDAVAHAFLGTARFAVGDADASDAAMARALALDPDGYWSNLKAGERWLRLGDAAAAETHLLRALRASEPGTPAYDAAATALARTRTRRDRSIAHRAFLPRWRRGATPG